MAVYVNNITINTGEYFSRDFYLDNIDGTPLNLVGYAASSYIRKHPESLSPTAKFNVGFVDRNNGRIRVSLASSITKEIKPGRYVYDVLFTDTENKKSIVIEGNILATDDISTGCQFVKTEYLYSGFGVIPESDGINCLNNVTSITVNDVDDYGVVHLGTNCNCSQLTDTITLLQNSNNLEKIINYIKAGGVVWFNTEWFNGAGSGVGCANRANTNTILTLLGSEIRQEADSPIVGNLARSDEPSVISSGFPSVLYCNATATFTGGTLVYGYTGLDFFGNQVNNARLVVYEKIGYGILYVSGDVNTWDQGPYSLRLPNEYYNALRALVLNT
jgi:hypothetical protein